MAMERAESIRELCLACQSELSQAASTEVRSPRSAPAGILNVNKPPGPTSHDVVDRIRAASGVRRVGHAGTLDPSASGVLLVCMGQATRVSEYLMESEKSYDAWIQLGITTDTGDAEGNVVRRVPDIDTTRERVLEALHLFRGPIEQVPPMHSALKHQGVTLYRLARRGIEVERAPRTVEIHDLRLTEWTPPSFRVFIECSKGTYIRALAADLGEALGTGAHLEQLVRVACGPYRMGDAVSLHEAERSFSNGRWPQILHRLDEALLHLEAFVVDAETEAKIRYGQQIEGPEPRDSLLCRTYTPSGVFVAILQYDQGSKTWQPRKVFNPHEATA